MLIRRKLPARDRLWVFADPGLDQLIIRCELMLGGPVSVESLRELVQERLVSKFERFSWVIKSCGGVDKSGSVDLLKHVTENSKIDINSSRPLWQFNLVDKQKIEIGVHHCLADGLSLVAILKRLTEKNPSPITKPVRYRSKPSWNLAFRTLQGIGKTIEALVFSPKVKLALSGRGVEYSSSDWQKPLVKSNRTDFESILEKLVLAPELGISNKSIIAIPVTISTLNNRINNGLGNKFALSPLPLKMEQSIVEEFRTIKKQGEVLGAYFMSVFIGSLPPFIGRTFSKFASSHILGIISGVQVSSSVLRLLDSEIKHIKAWAPILAGQKFSITSVHYAGAVSLNRVIRH